MVQSVLFYNVYNQEWDQAWLLFLNKREQNNWMSFKKRIATGGQQKKKNNTNKIATTRFITNTYWVPIPLLRSTRSSRQVSMFFLGA
jgi:hypothetical protein